MANWLNEKEAAEKVNRAPRTLRRYVKQGTWNVAYRTVNNRSFQYSEKDLENVFDVKRRA